MPASAIVDAAKVSTALAEKCGQIEACAKQVTEAKEAKDEQKLKDAKTNLDTLNVELDDLTEQLDEVKAAKRRNDLMTQAKSLAAPAAPATPRDMNVPSVPAEAKDHLGEEKVRRQAFFDYMRCEDVVGQKRELIAPKSKKLLECGSKGSPPVVIPKTLMSAFVGQRIAAQMGAPVGKAILATLNAVTNPSRGDFLLNDQYIAQMQQLPFPEPVLLPRVTIVPTSSGTSTIWPALAQTDAANATGDFGGVSYSWIDEADDKPETEPTFDQITITAYEVAGYTEVSQRALNRSEIALEAYLRSLFAATFEYEIDRVIFQGTGVGQPLGIVPAAGVRAVARQTAGTVTYKDYVDLKHAIYSHHRAGARYLEHDDVEQATENLLDGDGRPIFKASVMNGPFDTINGYPYDVSYNCSALGTAGDVIYGNPAWYTLTMEEEFGIARSEHYKFRNDMIAYRMYAVVGGRPMLPRAFAILSDTDS